MRSLWERSDFCTSGSQMERGCADLSVVGADDFDVCNDEPVFMVVVLAGMGKSKLEDCIGNCSTRNWGLSDRIAIRSQGRRAGIFHRDGYLAHSTYSVVYPWHRHFVPRYLKRCETASYFCRSGSKSRLRSAVSIRYAILTVAPAGVRLRHFVRRLRTDALICHGTKSVLPRPREGVGRARLG